MATRRELKQAVGERYRAARGKERRQILNEFVKVSGYSGTQVRKRYYPPLTPSQRLLASDAVEETIKRRLRDQFAALDPVVLLKAIRDVQQELIDGGAGTAATSTSPPAPEYFSAFASAWHSHYATDSLCSINYACASTI